MKKVFLFSLLLLAISGTLLTVQWIGYEKLSSASEKVIAHQTIEADIKQNRLYVHQTLDGIPGENPIDIKFPADAEEISCSEGDACVIGGQSASLTVKGNSATVHYYLPLPNEKPSVLLTNWQASFDNVDILTTELLVTDHMKKGGQWISSLKQTGAKKLSLIHFYSFEGKAAQPPLFWQKTPLNKQEFNQLTVFSETETEVPQRLLDLPFSQEDIEPQTVVITKEVPPQHLDGLTFIRTENELRAIRTARISNYVHKHFIFSEEEKWLASFIAVSLYSAQPMHMKAAEMSETIAGSLTVQQQQSWKQALSDLKGKEVTAAKLDKALAAVKQEGTDFFVKNKTLKTPVVPLAFFDSRPVVSLGQETSFHAKKINGVLYLPLKEAALSLGFSVNVLSEKEWLLKKDFEAYRFYMNENRVVLNEHAYALYNTALKREEGIVYIDKIWFQKLFLVEVKEKPDAIELEPYGI